ncbi:GspH/FimT family pseudopilin [Variovorax robiniae]|uniref:Type II secretion system protein H n=1 Tax=Variovorax robiniae TaxID=1836199 RepID=A0ABU8XHK0_9BURK
MLVGARKPRRPSATVRGFTLVELVFTITMVALLATIAAPSFRQFIMSQRVRNASFDFMTALTLARSEAITRNASVDLVRTSGSWSGGWTVAADAGVTTLLNQQSMGGVSITDSASLAKISYASDGRSTTAATQFTVAPATTMPGVTPRCISLGLGGVPSSKAGAC